MERDCLPGDIANNGQFNHCAENKGNAAQHPNIHGLHVTDAWQVFVDVAKLKKESWSMTSGNACSVSASNDETPTVVRAGNAFGSMQKPTQETMIVK